MQTQACLVPLAHQPTPGDIGEVGREFGILGECQFALQTWEVRGYFLLHFRLMRESLHIMTQETWYVFPEAWNTRGPTWLHPKKSTAESLHEVVGSSKTKRASWRMACASIFIRFKMFFPPRVICACSVTELYLTLCDPMDCNHQALLSMGFPRQEYWSGLTFPPSGDLPYPGIEPASPLSSAWAGRFFNSEPPGKPCQSYINLTKSR